jgi:hypothetical protein
MESKSLIWIGLFLGSTLGGYIPTLFGADIFSGWSIFGSAAGAFAGIYVAYKIANY